VNIDAIDKRIIARLQGDLPLEPRPFAQLAAEVGLSEAQVVERIARLERDKIMRRFGATLRHQQSGFPANVMVAWRVEESRVDEVGDKLASFRRVSHCYWRRPCPDFPYNVFSMVHGKSEAECRELVEEMAREVGNIDHQLLFSVEELKKTSMQYY
jgi:DNA-binding Lrp family transcriptional regulator